MLLRREQKDDDTMKKACEDQITEATHKKEDHQAMIDHLEQEETRLHTELTEVNTNKNATDVDIDDHLEIMEAALDNRNTEHDRLEQSLMDDRAAVKLLKGAIKSLAVFYKNNEGQLQIRKDPAPDATFGGSAKAETSGIVGILENIKADLEHDIEEATRAEAEDGEAYQETLVENKKTLKDLRKRRADLLIDTASFERKVANKENDIDAENNSKNATQVLLEDLEKSCEWTDTLYEKRKTARTTEMNELIQSKATLQGFDEADEEAFLQSHTFLGKHL
jgi:chromosome segregation ATPase